MGIPIQPQITNLTPVCQSIVNELTVAHPDAEIMFTASITVTGQCDPSRIAQVFSNLIGDAVRHGNSQRPINVTLTGDGTTANFCVQNPG
jgi:signal transduction histidine kinase